jgi:hypothetical protein
VTRVAVASTHPTGICANMTVSPRGRLIIAPP